MLHGVNDSDADARELVRLLQDIPAKVNLIPFNPWPGSAYTCSSNNRIHAFARIVEEAGHASPVRTPRGRDILAACGQLRTESQRRRDPPAERGLSAVRPCAASWSACSPPSAASSCSLIVAGGFVVWRFLPQVAANCPDRILLTADWRASLERDRGPAGPARPRAAPAADRDRHRAGAGRGRRAIRGSPGILVRLAETEHGLAVAQELRDAVRRFRAGGKFAIAYADTLRRARARATRATISPPPSTQIELQPDRAGRPDRDRGAGAARARSPGQPRRPLRGAAARRVQVGPGEPDRQPALRPQPRAARSAAGHAERPARGRDRRGPQARRPSRCSG